MIEATMDELMQHIKAGGKLRRGMTRDDLLLKDEGMTNEEYFEQMFPSLVNADAFTIGSKRFVSMNKVLEIIDEIDEYQVIRFGCMAYGGGKDELKRRILALKEERG